MILVGLLMQDMLLISKYKKNWSPGVLVLRLQSSSGFFFLLSRTLPKTQSLTEKWYVVCTRREETLRVQLADTYLPVIWLMKGIQRNWNRSSGLKSFIKSRIAPLHYGICMIYSCGNFISSFTKLLFSSICSSRASDFEDVEGSFPAYILIKKKKSAVFFGV